MPKEESKDKEKKKSSSSSSKPKKEVRPWIVDVTRCLSLALALSACMRIHDN
jgi:hypothetical protein